MFSRQPNKEQQTKDILERGSILHMALQDADGFFIQPVSYGFSTKKGQIVLYFCGEKKGRKYEAYKQNPKVSVLIDHLSGYRIDSQQYLPCFESLRGTGTIEEVEGAHKKHALFALLQHCGFEEQHIAFDKILLDPELGFYKIDLEEVVTKKSV